MLKKVVTDEYVEKIVARTVASMSFEDLICSDDDKEAIRRVLWGKTTAKDEVNNIIKKCKAN